jgi:hypothetical protein
MGLEEDRCRVDSHWTVTRRFFIFSNSSIVASKVPDFQPQSAVNARAEENQEVPVGYLPLTAKLRRESNLYSLLLCESGQNFIPDNQICDDLSSLQNYVWFWTVIHGSLIRNLKCISPPVDFKLCAP